MAQLITDLDLCGGKNNVGLSDDIMCLMFSCVVNTQRGDLSVSVSGMFNFWLISNLKSHAGHWDMEKSLCRNTSGLCGRELGCGQARACVVSVCCAQHFLFGRDVISRYHPAKRKRSIFKRANQIYFLVCPNWYLCSISPPRTVTDQ